MAILSAAVAAAALAAVLAKGTLVEVDAFTFVWLQIAIGAGLLTVHTLVLRRERVPALDRRTWLLLAAIGVCHFTAARVLFIVGLQHLPATTHAYLVNFVGVVTLALSIPLLGERPTRRQLAGTLLALAGLTVYFRAVPSGDEAAGVLVVGGGVVALAMTNNLIRRLTRAPRFDLSDPMISMLTVWIGGVPVALAGVWRDGLAPLPHFGATVVVAFSALVTIAVGATVFNYALRTLRSYEASVLASGGVIYTAVFAFALLGERLLAHQWVGIAMMLLGIIAVQTGRRA